MHASHDSILEFGRTFPNIDKYDQEKQQSQSWDHI